MHPRDLSSHTPYVAGRGIEEVARDLGLDADTLVKLSSNENPLGPSPAAVDAIKVAAETIHAYPKTSHTDLTSAIADQWGVTASQIWLAAGGDGALDYLSRAMLDPGDRVLVPEPGFAYYAMSARFHHGEVDTYQLEKANGFAQTAAGILAPYDDHRIIYVTSPHNPSGSICPVDVIERVANETNDETLIVVDEAYGEFTDEPSARTLLDDRDDVAVLRTFSKAYGLAGLRLGYAIVPEPWADVYARVNTPFAASELACRAGLAALEDDEHVDRSVAVARSAREELIDGLAVPTWPSGGNFVLAEVGDASAVADELQERGVIVRDCTSFGLPACIRVSAGTEAQTTRAIDAINEVVTR